MSRRSSRREFIRDLGIGAAALPFVLNLPGLGFANQERRKQRLVVMFSPDGVVPKTFWPDEEGESFTLKESLTPLEPFRDKTLILHGVRLSLSVNDSPSSSGQNVLGTTPSGL